MQSFLIGLQNYGILTSQVLSILIIIFIHSRVVEINGKLVLNKTKEDMLRLLAVAPDPAQIVVLRVTPKPQTYLLQTQQYSPNPTSNEVANLRAELGIVRERAEEAQKTKDGLKGDNLRLTHRISYLEEQVAELLQRNRTENSPEIQQNGKSTPVITSVKSSQNVTNISISSPPSSPSNRNSSSSADLQIFQKGPQVTALVANLPGMENDMNRDMLRTLRPRSSHSNVSSTHIPAPDRHNNRKHHHHHLDYNSESDQIRKHNSHNHHYRKHDKYDKHDKHDERHASRKSLSALEANNRHKYPDSRSADELSQDCEPRDARSVKSLDFDSEPNHYAKPLKIHQRIIDYTSEPLNDKKLPMGYHYQSGEIIRHSSRPKPPKKPIRLSLHRAQSLQSMEAQLMAANSMQQLREKIDDRKPLKRNHRGDQAPLNGLLPTIVKVERPTEQPPQPPQRHTMHQMDNHYESSNSRASSRNENGNGHSALRWPSALQHITFSRGSRNHNGHVSDGGKWC